MGTAADDIPGNAQPAYEITINIGLFLIIIFLLVGLAIFIAFVCYHAKDKKIEQLKKLIKEPLTEKEIQLITDYRNLNDKDKEVIDNAAKNLTEDKSTNDNMPFTKG